MTCELCEGNGTIATYDGVNDIDYDCCPECGGDGKVPPSHDHLCPSTNKSLINYYDCSFCYIIRQVRAEYAQ
jgi:DnaJ-class molecular chaperone